MKLTKRDRIILEEYFDIYETENTIDLEAWTNGGVDMFITLDKDDKKKLTKQLEEYIEVFDIDEEIEIHRQMKDYKNDFTIRESLEDFENWIDWVKEIKDKLEGVE